MVSFSLFNTSGYTLTEPAINQYLKELSKLLCCNNKKRRKILLDFQNRLTDFYASQTDTLTYNQIVEQFGSPKDVANSFLAETNSLQLCKLILHHSQVKKAILIGAILIFLFLLFRQIYAIYQYTSTKHDYIIETLYPSELTPNLEDLGITDYTTY